MLVAANEKEKDIWINRISKAVKNITSIFIIDDDEPANNEDISTEIINEIS